MIQMTKTEEMTGVTKTTRVTEVTAMAEKGNAEKASKAGKATNAEKTADTGKAMNAEKAADAEKTAKEVQKLCAEKATNAEKASSAGKATSISELTNAMREKCATETIRNITDKSMAIYQAHLLREEYAPDTVKKYLRDIRAFVTWLTGRKGGNCEAGGVDKEAAAGWKAYLSGEGYAPVTINAMLSSLNGFFGFLGWEECKVKFLKIQRRTFRDQDRELTKTEYGRLLETARGRGNLRLALLLEAICATGIRVSEVKYITVEALGRRRTDISLKGKVRTILLPGKLCKKLMDYAKRQGIGSGEVFVTRNGKSVSRRQIWQEMKNLCSKAGVSSSKVFPHNLRHLFARIFYKSCRDIVKLADVLGHSSIETTRIYLISTGENHARQMERLGLIS